MDETHCKYVGSFGLVKTCNHRYPIIIPDWHESNASWYQSVESGSILHVCPQALPTFVSHVLPSIKNPFKLLTNNSDKTLPDDYQDECTILLNHPLLIHWYSQNWISNEQKVTRIPIGLDYHSLMPAKKKHIWSPPEIHPWGIKKFPSEQEQFLNYLRSISVPFWQRQIKAYANFHFLMTTRYGKIDRVDAYNTIPKELVSYQINHTNRDECWSSMTKHAFVVSPHGNGLDCHRTWEALSLGCIPIVKTSGLDKLFDDLPVWIVQEWKDVSLENMKAKIEEFKNRTFNYEKLTLAYWKSKIINT